MARIVAIAGIALVIGILIGIGTVSLQRSAESPVARAIKEPEAASIPPSVEAPGQRTILHIASSVPTSALQIGTMATKTADKLSAISDGSLELKLHEPNSLAPNEELFDKLAGGEIDAVWASTNFFAERDSVFWLFSTVPFGPPAGEFLAWLAYGGGQELMDANFARFEIKPVVCTVLPPESGGWFRHEITSPADFKGLRMRFMGIGARVVARLGAEPVTLNGGDTFYALQSGAIDAAEFSLPAIDLRVGLDQVAKHYYFPGWHQQSSLITLLFSQKVWDRLSEAQRQQISSVCGDNIRESLAEGEALQVKALQEIRARGVTVHTWPPAVLGALEKAWKDVVREEKAANPEFRKVWESYDGFRRSYTEWRDLGYLP
ncbi:MAG TPA: TRAP transporter substrate-binding protein [Ferrovibrio sp.]|jgi:TRAP-type mannitol/chloroaromatic compound transport system substrate-binding protein|uniref:TRAP transporter substrate-binding protein n=1 Tax=Ferrovibrio sp. TaxID=1917215 RepID=UPI002B4AD146|nr:TRAP transporter substrate-binding protein [Ferrovibrio sp.]HLT78584.1 TRAP transporter substrate-binding protein [Ferrovibrio sp.]